jgi:ribosomal protein S18 acetylase RimI-like enzyme
MATFRIRRLRALDREFVTDFLDHHRVSPAVVSRGRLHEAESLPGFVALRDSDAVGLLVYTVVDSELEIVILHTVVDRIGLGSSLLREAKKAARRLECHRMWVVVTNDNTKALGFYQRNGFRMVAFYAAARDVARAMRPSLPELGVDGIPVHDEIELELLLRSSAAETAAL